MYALIDDNNIIYDIVSCVPEDNTLHVHKLTPEQLATINDSTCGHAGFMLVNGDLIYRGVKAKTIIGPPDGFTPVLAPEQNPHEIGFFGNIWVRKLYFPTKEQVYEGHKHSHDHVSLLISGSVKVEVEGYEPKIFKAPTYIIIRAEYEHKITALEDNTLWWCLHAMRTEEGEVEELYTEYNDPLSGGRIKSM